LFTEILQKSAGFSNTSFLFCGDWNVVQNKSDDTYNVIHDRNQNARKKIEELKETFELPFPRLAGEAEKLKTMSEWSVL
jgi:hypothetical protein